MKNRQQKNHQGSRKSFGLQTGKLISSDGFQKQYSLLWKAESHYGALGIAAHVNCSSILKDASLLIIAFRTLTGLSERSLAVLMIVISTAMLLFPRLVMLIKVILRNSTAFLMPCSAGLFVGGIAGYFRNTKSSSLNVIKRLRILSVSWRDSGAWKRSFLNRLRISLQAERYSVPERAECAL
jgi:hypothetical protein